MMKRKSSLPGWAMVAALALSVAGMATTVVAQDKTQDRTQDRTRDQIYGSQLMTQAERNEYQQRMRNMKTEQEREAFRQQHHQQMQERARERGVTLPAEPAARRGGGAWARARVRVVVPPVVEVVADGESPRWWDQSPTTDRSGFGGFSSWAKSMREASLIVHPAQFGV